MTGRIVVVGRNGRVIVVKKVNPSIKKTVVDAMEEARRKIGKN